MGWSRFFRRSHWDRERAAELESYLQIETDENIARGMSPTDARRAAHMRLGNSARIREEVFHMNTIAVLDSVGRDLRYALRGMRRSPTFSLAVVLTLALGLGANTAIFAVVDGVLIKPLPYPNAEELVSLEHVAPGIKVDDFQMSPTQYVTYREEGRVFQHIGVWLAGGTTITGIGDPEQARLLAVTDGVLHALGIQPMLGRLFTEADNTTTAPGFEVGAGTVILTYGYWQRRFGGDLSVVGRQILRATAPSTLPRLEEISLDPRVVAFAAAISLASSLLFAAIPALKYSRPHDSPGGAGRGTSASRERLRTRNTLVVVQVGLALVLLIGSGLMIRTFQALQRVDPGFADAATLQTARIWIPPQQIREPERVTRMQHEILDKIASIPGVRAAGFASSVPMEAGRVGLTAVSVEGHRDEAGTTPPGRRLKYVSPGYFDAVGTRLVAGRDITWNDMYGHARVVVISENFAREVWGSAAAALGRRIHEPSIGGVPPVWREIVGVVQNVHEDALHQPAPTMVYWPVLMDSFGGAPLSGMPAINFVIRSDLAGSESLVSAVRNEVWSINSSLPVFLVRTMSDLYDESLARTSFALVMLAIAAAMALGLGLIGIYGVISYVVAQRAREIGIRMALGAEPSRLQRMFVRHGVMLAGIGILGGLAGAVALTRLMSSLLFGISPLDPATYAAVLVVLTAAAALASYVPARRAATMNPMSTLAAE